MKIHSCYDAGDGWADRYTVFFKGRGTLMVNGSIPAVRTRYCLAMSARPFHPQGVGLHTDGIPGKHNGKRIKFEDLPPECQQCVNDTLNYQENT